MALTRKFLTAMGIEEDKIEQIIGAHTDTVNGLKEEIDKYKTDAEKLPDVQKELTKANDKITQLENDDTESPFKKQYEDLKKEHEKLQTDFDKFKADIDAKALLTKKTDAYKKLLKDAGIADKRLDTILKVTALDDVELEDDGTIKGLDDLTAKVKDEWADFIVEKDEQGAKTPNPPASGEAGDGGEKSIAAKLASQYHANMYGSKED